MIERIKLRKDIIRWLNVKRGLLDIIEEDDLIAVDIDDVDVAEMVIDLEKHYKNTSIGFFDIHITDEETLGSLIDTIYKHLNRTTYVPKEKQLFGIYYSSREFARQHSDPLLDVVVATSEIEAESIAKKTVKDQGAGILAVPLSYYETGYKTSSEGSDLRAVYFALIQQIKNMWAHKNKAQ